jgi:hypothetical protein
MQKDLRFILHMQMVFNPLSERVVLNTNEKRETSTTNYFRLSSKKTAFKYNESQGKISWHLNGSLIKYEAK